MLKHPADGSPLTFTKNRLVPDGMDLVEISMGVHPSNVAVFNTAANLGEAVPLALKAMWKGAQAVVWITDNKLRWPRATQGKIREHTDRRQAELAGLFEEVITPIDEAERSNLFDPHIDSDMSGSKKLDHLSFVSKDIIRTLPFRIIENVYGPPLLLFARNEVCARELLGSRRLANPQRLGTAYMTPYGSVTFLCDRNWGIKRASIHTLGQVEQGQAYKLRNTIHDCTGFKFAF